MKSSKTERCVECGRMFNVASLNNKGECKVCMDHRLAMESVSEAGRKCSKCGKVKLLSEYYKSNKKGCKACLREESRARYALRKSKGGTCCEKLKTCRACKKDLPVSEFHKKASCKDGLNTICKECRKAYNREYKKRKRLECDTVHHSLSDDSKHTLTFTPAIDNGSHKRNREVHGLEFIVGATLGSVITCAVWMIF